MDKGQLTGGEKSSVTNLQTSAAAAAASSNSNKDDVVVVITAVSAASKKEKSQQNAVVESDVSSNQTTTKTQATRGKEINDKKGEGKNLNLNEFTSDTEELLGSVTTYNCHGTRTSARVIQKMRQDQQTRPTTPPPAERENVRGKDERSTTQKTPSQVRANRPTWSNVERNHFFDALNEFGKDFEAIGNFINSKLKRRSPAVDVSFKSKDQVRQHYYQTYHKICKYVRFSEEVRKPAQELYALINYGEMRRKLQFVTDKHFMKLKNLVYHGHVTVRCKGKNIRIKTPSCKALRRLNQLDDSLEDIRLPSKIEVIISPANMEAFGRVQTIAQNPRCRTTVPLHKKLINFINMFQHKWRSMDVRVAEEGKTMNSHDHSNHTATTSTVETPQVQDPEICFLPKAGVAIHRPLLSITEYLSSVNICLTAYEERMGITMKGEMLNVERHTTSSSTNNASAAAQSSSSSTSTNAAGNNKRSRTESGSEKRSPDLPKRLKNIEVIGEVLSNPDEAPSSSSMTETEQFPGTKQHESSSDELSDEIQELLSDSMEIHASKEDLTHNVVVVERNTAQSIQSQPNVVTAEISSSTSNSTTANVSNITTTTPQVSSVRAKASRAINSKAQRSVFKPLLNDDIIQRIRSGWTASRAGDITIGDLYVVLGHDSKLELDYYWLPEKNVNPHVVSMTSTESPATANGQSLENIEGEPRESSVLSNKLKHLLLIANLSERMRKRPCTCDRNSSIKSRYEKDLAARTFVANKSPYANCSSTGTRTSDTSSNMFRQPMIPLRRTTTIDPVKQLTTLTRQKMSRQILVQRLLLPSNGNVKSMNNISNVNTTPTNPAMPPSTSSLPTTLRNTSQVPWNSTNKMTTSLPAVAATTTAASSTAVSSNDATDSQDLRTFLDSLNSESAEIMQPQEETQTSHEQLRQDIFDEMGDRIDGPSSVQSLDSAFDECSNTSFLNGLSPMHLIRDSTSNSRWLEDNINDFSLTSLLGHLDDINAGRDILDPSSSMSVISESSVDYMHKFQEIKALLQSQEKD